MHRGSQLANIADGPGPNQAVFDTVADPALCLCSQLRSQDSGSVTDLQNLLRQTAEVYTNLVQHANAAGC